MRVLFITHSYPRFVGDAAGSFLLLLAQALADVGDEVEVLAPSAPGLAAFEEVGGVPVHRYRYAPRAWETLAYTGTMAEDARASWRGGLALGGLLLGGISAALRCQRERQPDVIHAHWWFPSGVIGAVTSALSGVPLVLTMHGSDVRFALGIPASRPAFRWVTSTSAVVTTVSAWLAEEARGIALHLKPEVAPMPVATHTFHPGERARDPRRVLFVGRLNEQKGILRVVEAVSRMRETAAVDVVGGGPLGDSARRLAESAGIADRFTWHGPLPQHALPDLYRAAAVLVVASEREGLGLSAVEAELCGTPVVGFDSGGVPETLVNGRTGLLVPPGNTEALATALDALVGDPARAQAMGTAGAEWARECFSPNAAAQRYSKLYRDALDT